MTYCSWEEIMNQQTPFSPLAIALLLAAATLSPQPVGAGTSSFVTISAFDSTGKSTGTCLSTSGTLGGYVLETCNSSDAKQQFEFNQHGGTLSQNGNCMAVLTGLNNPNPGSVWNTNTIVAKAPCATANAAEMWQLSGTKIEATQGPKKSNMLEFCMTADSSVGRQMRLGVCAQPATLTEWHVK
jgi:hypothetical protein